MPRRSPTEAPRGRGTRGPGPSLPSSGSPPGQASGASCWCHSPGPTVRTDRPGMRQGPHPRRQGHRPDQPTAPRLHPESDLVRPRGLVAELVTWMQTLALTADPARRWEPKRLGLRLLSIAGRLAITGRRRLLHLPASHRSPTYPSTPSAGSTCWQPRLATAPLSRRSVHVRGRLGFVG
jgi:hypothetical protein